MCNPFAADPRTGPGIQRESVWGTTMPVLMLCNPDVENRTFRIRGARPDRQIFELRERDQCRRQKPLVWERGRFSCQDKAHRGAERQGPNHQRAQGYLGIGRQALDIVEKEGRYARVRPVIAPFALGGRTKEV